MDTLRTFDKGCSHPPELDRPSVFTLTNPSGKPIRVACKIRGKKRPNVFLDDRGFPDQSHEFDVILHNIQGGPILWKCKPAALLIDDFDPCFHSHYAEKIHGEKLHTELDLSHLDSTTRDLVYNFSRNTGRFSMIRDNSSPSRTINVPLTLALHDLSV